MTVAYATSAEYESDTGNSAPAGIDRLLERASERIDDVVIAPFVVDADTELPTDTDIATALRKATCFQVEFWQETGEANDIDGLAGSAVSVGSYQGRRAPRDAPRALALLRSAGLMSSGIGGYL